MSHHDVSTPAPPITREQADAMLARERDRTAACPSRSNGTCERINSEVGQRVGIAWTTCDQCLAAGPDTPAALTVRGKVVDFAKIGLQNTPARQARWSRVKGTWDKAASLTKSLTSGLVAKVSLEVLETRQGSCSTCIHRKPSGTPDEHYCDACGCGDKKLALLDHKLKYPYLECPMRREGFSNAGVPPNIAIDGRGKGFGDVITMLWAAEAYRVKGAEVPIAVGPGPHADLVRVFGHALAKGTEELVGHPEMFRAEARAESTRERVWLGEYPGINRFVRPRARLSADTLLGTLNRLTALCKSPSPVVMFPFTEHASRQWPLGHFADLAWGLHSRGVSVLAIGESRFEGHLKKFPHFLHGVTMEEIVYYTACAGSVVANDSFGAHLAGTLGIPTIAAVGPSRNVFTHIPEVIPVHVPHKRLSCVQCNFDPDRGYYSACDLTCRALSALTPGDICTHLEPYLASSMMEQ